MPKVLIADKMSLMAAELLGARGIDVEVEVGLSPGDLVKRLDGCDGLLVRSATKVTADVIGQAPSLRAIGRAGIGVDNIDLAAATKRGIVVMNTPGGNSVTTAEHAIALLFALAPPTARPGPASGRSRVSWASS